MTNRCSFYGPLALASTVGKQARLPPWRCHGNTLAWGSSLFPRASLLLPALTRGPPSPLSIFFPRSLQKLKWGHQLKAPGVGRLEERPRQISKVMARGRVSRVPSGMDRWHLAAEHAVSSWASSVDVVQVTGRGGARQASLLLLEGVGATFLTWFSASSMQMVLFKAHRFLSRFPSVLGKSFLGSLAFRTSWPFKAPCSLHCLAA